MQNSGSFRIIQNPRHIKPQYIKDHGMSHNKCQYDVALDVVLNHLCYCKEIHNTTWYNDVQSSKFLQYVLSHTVITHYMFFKLIFTTASSFGKNWPVVSAPQKMGPMGWYRHRLVHQNPSVSSWFTTNPVSPRKRPAKQWPLQAPSWRSMVPLMPRWWMWGSWVCILDIPGKRLEPKNHSMLVCRTVWLQESKPHCELN